MAPSPWTGEGWGEGDVIEKYRKCFMETNQANKFHGLKKEGASDHPPPNPLPSMEGGKKMNKLKQMKTEKRTFIGIGIIALGLTLIYLGVVQAKPTPKSSPFTSLANHSSTNEVQEILHQSALALSDEKYDAAVLLLEEALKKHPKNLDLMLQLGITYRKTGNLSGADEINQQALQANPNCAECLNNRAVALLETGEFQTAIELFKTAIQKRTPYPEAVLNLGIAYEKNGETQQAIDFYQQYLQLAPSHEDHPESALARERIRKLQEGF
jgi:Tfp pilus assembly protein PilF